MRIIEELYSGWRGYVWNFLNNIGRDTFTALSPDYESFARLVEVVNDTKARIEELLLLESDVPKALARFTDDQLVRILTTHKS